MSNPLSGVLNKARTSFGGPLAGFQGPQKMQMPPRPPGLGGGMPPGMMPQGPMMAPDSGMPSMPAGGGMPPMPAPGNTGIVPPHMRTGGPMMPMGGAPGGMMPQGPVTSNRGRHLAMGLRKKRMGADQRFGNISLAPMDGMPSTPSGPPMPPGATLA